MFDDLLVSNNITALLVAIMINMRNDNFIVKFTLLVTVSVLFTSLINLFIIDNGLIGAVLAIGAIVVFNQPLKYGVFSR